MFNDVVIKEVKEHINWCIENGLCDPIYRFNKVKPIIHWKTVRDLSLFLAGLKPEEIKDIVVDVYKRKDEWFYILDSGKHINFSVADTPMGKYPIGIGDENISRQVNAKLQRNVKFDR